MNKLFVLFCLLIVFVPCSMAQTLYLKSEESAEAIPYATISSNDPQLLVVTDVNGAVDLSDFKGVEKIRISSIGFTTLITSYSAIEQRDFQLYLKASVISLEQVVISAYRDGLKREISLQIQTLQQNAIKQQGSYNLTDALDHIAGVSQLSTGTGISKPVVRGLYGNRLLVLFSGLRFDNQQWQDEHGLGLSDMGISRVELIKGPLSLLYGTEALGGVINIIEEEPPASGIVETDAGLEVHSNTLGGSFQLGTKANFGKKWYRLRIGNDSYADYHDGKGNRVVNSRYGGYYLKSSYGFERRRWKSENHYHFSYNTFGFIFDGKTRDYFSEGSEWSRGMNGPHHIVMLNLFSSLNTIQLHQSTLKLNAGIQSNRRAEDEGGNELSLDMHLLTAQYALKWNKDLSKHSRMVIANNSSWENNNNLGRRKLVPDANLAESALSLYLKHQWSKLVVEYGAGGGFRYIETKLTPTVNSAEKNIDPFAQSRSFYNGLLGLSFMPSEYWTLKFNLASGVRAPNLSELSSNGLHEGIYTYEIGNPNMKNEQNVNVDLSADFQSTSWEWGISAFYNHFNHYIYLDPTGEDWFGFPIYRFRQHAARIYGSEAFVKLHSGEAWEYSLAYEGLIGELSKQVYLPYMPAQQVSASIAYKMGRWAASVQNKWVLSQERFGEEEYRTPAYRLLTAHVGWNWHGKASKYSLNLVANNLLNEAYYDHLSRLKSFGFLNSGRDISLNLTITFKNSTKNKHHENN